MGKYNINHNFCWPTLVKNKTPMCILCSWEFFLDEFIRDSTHSCP